jgi:hypothetical protein
MFASSLFSFLTLVSPITSISLPTIHSPTNRQQQPLPNTDSSNTNFRDLLETDLPAITTLILEAFAPSPAWNYLIPDLQSHKSQIWTCLHSQFTRGFSSFDRNTTFVKVITVPVPSTNTDPQPAQIAVSLAVWNIRSPDTTTTATLSLPTCAYPPGTNLTRAASFNRQMSDIDETYFSHNASLYLNLLATHPAWDGHGFGARHVEWGQELARTLEPVMPVTLLATPAGWPLYDSLGFASVHNATLETLGDSGGLWYEVMEWK